MKERQATIAAKNKEIWIHNSWIIVKHKMLLFCHVFDTSNNLLPKTNLKSRMTNDVAFLQKKAEISFSPQQWGGGVGRHRFEETNSNFGVTHTFLISPRSYTHYLRQSFNCTCISWGHSPYHHHSNFVAVEPWSVQREVALLISNELTTGSEAGMAQFL